MLERRRYKKSTKVMLLANRVCRSFATNCLTMQEICGQPIEIARTDRSDRDSVEDLMLEPKWVHVMMTAVNVMISTVFIVL